MSILRKLFKRKPTNQNKYTVYYNYHNIINDTQENWHTLLGQARVEFLVKTGDLKPLVIRYAN